MIQYVHTNLIAKDSQKLIAFYQAVFDCTSIGQTRDLQGVWLDQLTGCKNAHIVGEHLALPGFGADGPTLEIFSYDQINESAQQINQQGFAHLAFLVDDLPDRLARVVAAGGQQLGDVVAITYGDGRTGQFVYTRDLEGNIVELQSWQTGSKLGGQEEAKNNETD